jgi:nitrite reductase/ring-hydroxylating ferredoxin subunit
MRVLIGAERDVKDGFVNSFSHAGRKYVVVYYRKKIRAFDAKCPHANGDLSRASIEGDFVACPSHGLRFSLESGAADSGEVKDDFLKGILARGLETMRLKFVEVEVADGDAYALIGE